MKKNAFTLVELIATITILGIITLITAPSVLKLIQSNDEKTIEYFGKSLVNSARSYVTDNKVLIDKSTNRNIECSALNSANYIKSCKINGYNCTTTRVNVARDSKDTYTYKYTLTCKKTKTNKAYKTYTG